MRKQEQKVCEDCGTSKAIVYLRLDSGRNRRDEYFLCGKCWAEGTMEMKKEEKGKKGKS